MIIKRHILPVIVVAQFMCTSLWFAGNVVMPELAKTYLLSSGALGHITSAVQFGFIVGTLIFATLNISDRYSPSKVFFISALAAAALNAGIIINNQSFASLLLFRFSTGFFLAGIYPVGMKIASDYYNKGLGKALGFLVGALVLGTAFPHLLRSLTSSFPMKTVVLITSALSVTGGLLILVFVADGPYRNKSAGINFSAIFSGFKSRNFRSVAFGYFGHNWELYTLWAFVPVILKRYQQQHLQSTFSVSMCSFFIIAAGGLACVASGFISASIGSKKTAFIALLLSGVCCVISPLLYSMSPPMLISFLVFWGLVVVADSPMFSTLVAQNAPVEIKGTALTIVNCIGFSITIISIQLINWLSGFINQKFVFVFLAIGPLLGLIALSRLNKKTVIIPVTT